MIQCLYESVYHKSCFWVAQYSDGQSTEGESVYYEDDPVLFTRIVNNLN